MLFFRSEESARSWSHARGTPLRPPVTMDQLWKLATTWYGTRLEENSRRPRAEEIVGIFASVGLADDFWDLLSIRHRA
jgi:hypothetical protein